MSSFRFVVVGAITALVFITPGCSNESKEPAGQASQDLRSNLESSTKAAAEVAKEKPKAP